MLKLAVLALVVSVAAAQLIRIPLFGITERSDRRTEGTNQQRGGGRPFQPEDPQRRRRYQPAPQADNVDLVIVGLVSGNRNPETFMQDDPNQDRWGEEGVSQLNDVGKREAFNFGRALRQRYGQQILADNFYPTNFMSFSSTGESEQMTCQALNAGLFPPTGRFVVQQSLKWQPVPVTTDDTLLGISRMIRCPKAREVLEPIFSGQTPVLQQVMHRERDVVDYIVKSTGIRRNAEDLAEIADNLQQLRVRNLPFPEWAERPSQLGMDKDTLYERVQVWRNAIEVACSVYEPCRRLFSGVLLNQINEIIESVTQRQQVNENEGQTNVNRGQNQGQTNVNRGQNQGQTNVNSGQNQGQTNVNRGQGQRNQLGMVVYTGDVETILSVFRVLGLNNFNIPANGGFILEIQANNNRQQQQQQQPKIRVLYHEPGCQNTKQGQRQQQQQGQQGHCFFLAECVQGQTTGQMCNCPNNWCPIQNFRTQTQQYQIRDVRLACGTNQDCVGNRQFNNFDDVTDPTNKRVSKTVDCSYESDKYPERACEELSNNGFCSRNNFVRNVVCRRTCNCNQKFDNINGKYLNQIEIGMDN